MDSRVVPKARRKYAPKARGGCTTCRARHVRCDQSRPRCGACQRSKRICRFGGDKSDDETSGLKVVLWEPDESQSMIQASASQFPGQTSQELRAVQYFRAVVVSRLAAAFDGTLWERIFLQAAQSSLPLRRSIVALATHWEKVVVPGSEIRSTVDWKPDTYSLQQYTRAISSLRHALQQEVKPRTEELLMSTLLFFCIEIFQNHYESACRQLASGTYMYCHWKKMRSRDKGGLSYLEASEFDRHIGQIFRRVMVQSMLFPVKNLLDPRLFVASFIPEAPPIPEKFDTLDQARDFFNSTVSVICHSAMVTNQMRASQRPQAPPIPEQFDTLDQARDFFKSTVRVICHRAMVTNQMRASQRPPEDEAFLVAARRFEQGQAGFREWRAAFDRFKATTAQQLDFEARGYCVVIEAQAIYVSLLFPPTPLASEMSFDGFGSSFRAILSMSTTLIDAKAERMTQREFHYPKFDSGIVPSVFLVGLRCRDPDMRRAAIALLRRGPRQEGLWNGDMMAAVAERIMVLEEEEAVAIAAGAAATASTTAPLHQPAVRLCTDIPLAARLCLVDVAIHSSRHEVTMTLESQDLSRPYSQRSRIETVPF